MRMIKSISLLILCTIFLGGCMNKQEISLSINIPNLNDYTILYVQGVDGNGSSSESTRKYINDDKKIIAFINKVNNIEITKPSQKEMTKQTKELNFQGNYIFALSDSKKMDNKLYHMNFFKDGSIQFQHPNKKVLIYLSKEKYPKLFKEIKKSLDINF